MDSASSRVKGLLLLVIAALLALVLILEKQRRDAQNQLMKLSVQREQVTQNQEENRAQAKRIIDRVGRLIVLPNDVEPTVATIVDVAALRARNTFYNKAENGDYLLVTTDRAILYDPDKNIILDVAPVQIQAAAPAAMPSSAGAVSSK